MTWREHLVSVLLALALILVIALAANARGINDVPVDPYTAHVTWADGKTEDVQATNAAACAWIKPALDLGLSCWRAGLVCGLQWVGRVGVKVQRVDCARGGPVPGGNCIRGFNC